MTAVHGVLPVPFFYPEALDPEPRISETPVDAGLIKDREDGRADRNGEEENSALTLQSSHGPGSQEAAEC
ncbi:hypothetical protein NDU88_007949 [Pleurodeles waltl]|uniref:Uncharacterized protein n=1 Tax=Pleurodeles waltl TaxID=8319 RepID=A0AAV7QM58_PLEWA|nr:hypothetical protein NDU88_007949 [Pleurodeles waltl]